MKYLKKSIYSLPLVAMMGLWSCASEEVLPVDQSNNEKILTLRISVDRGVAKTRTQLEDDGEGGLTSVWTWKDPNGKDEELLVVNSIGKVMGHLKLVEGAGNSKGIFEGSITNFSEDEIYNIWYGPTSIYVTSSGDDRLRYSNALQNSFSLSDFARMEVMSPTEDYAKHGLPIEYRLESGTTNIYNGHIMEDVKLESRFAMARFSLNRLPNATKGTLYISNKDGRTPVEIEYNSSIRFSSNGKISYTTTKNGVTYDKITVENAEAGKDVFIRFIPNNYNLHFNFVAEDGHEYNYDLGKSKDLLAGVYYTDGKGGGIPINFEKDPREVINYKVILKNEDGEVIETIEKKTVEDPTKIKLPEAPKKYDHDFVGWKEENNTESLKNKSEWTLSSGKTEVTLVPDYKQKTHTWYIYWREAPDATKNIQYRSVKDTAPQTYDLVKNSPKSPEKEGYKFKGWYINGQPVPEILDLTLENADRNTTIYAEWEEVTEVNYPVFTPGYNHGEFITNK